MSRKIQGNRFFSILFFTAKGTEVKASNASVNLSRYRGAFGLLVGFLVCGSFSCQKGPMLSIGDLEKLTTTEIIKMEAQKRYNVDPEPGLENILVGETKNGPELFVVSRDMKNDQTDKLLWQHPLDGASLLKLAFLQPGLPRSMIMAITKEQNGNDHILQIAGTNSFIWKKNLSLSEIKKLYIKKANEKTPDDVLILGNTEYRYNGFEYANYDTEGPLPFITRVAPSDTEGWIEIENRGSYVARGILTLSFAQLKPELQNEVALTRDIPTVKLYRAGSRVFKKGGGRVTLPYTIVEVVKEPFSSRGKIKLPLKLPLKTKSFLVRMSYTTGGRTNHWPLASEKTLPDAQGFMAYQWHLDTP